MAEFHSSKRTEGERLAYLGGHVFEYTHTNKNERKSFRCKRYYDLKCPARMESD